MFKTSCLKNKKQKAIFYSTPEAECKVESLQWAVSGTKASLHFANSSLL